MIFAYFVSLALRVIAIHIVEEIWVNKRVIQSRVEYCFLVVGTAFYGSAEGIVPRLACGGIHLVESAVAYLFFKVFTGVGYAHVRNAHLEFNDFLFIKFITEIRPYTIAYYLASELFFQTSFAIVPHPLGFYPLVFFRRMPNAIRRGYFVHFSYKIHWICQFRTVIAESPYHTHSFHLSRRYEFQHCAFLIGESESEIDKQVSFSFREVITSDTCTSGGGSFSFDIVFSEEIAVITRFGDFFLVSRAVF